MNFRATSGRRRPSTPPNATVCRRSSIGAGPTAAPTMWPRRRSSTWWQAADEEGRPRPSVDDDEKAGLIRGPAFLHYQTRHTHRHAHPTQHNTAAAGRAHVLGEVTMATDSDTDTDNVRPIRPFEEEAALAWLGAQPGGRSKLSDAELGRRWGWKRQRVGRRVKAWAKEGRITRRGNTITYTNVHVTEGAGPGTQVELVPPSVPSVVPPPVPPIVPPRAV